MAASLNGKKDFPQTEIRFFELNMYKQQPQVHLWGNT